MHQKNAFSLGGDWTLYYTPETGNTPDRPESNTPHIPAIVPGNVELDLVRAGIEDDPFYGINLYNFRKYEYYSWWFVREFDAPQIANEDDIILHFDGLDTFADIFINNTLAGSSDNMFIPHEFDITEFIKHGEKNTICIHISSPMNKVRYANLPVGPVASDPFGGEMMLMRKPPHSFGWDIMPRLLSAGIWRDVYIFPRPKTYITEVYYATLGIGNHSAVVDCKLRFVTDDTFVEGFSTRVTLQCGEHIITAEDKCNFVNNRIVMSIDNPKLWWPRGYGEQNLYTAKFELLQHGKVVDTRIDTIGIRLITIDKSYGGGENNKFQFIVNHTPIMVTGTNWVPLDALHSRDKERLQAAHDLLLDSGCNMVRCWGGNVYESQAFFDLCDERGIMVWQDFAMACGFYSQYQEFADIMDKEATAIIKLHRNHPSIALWAGDNEVDEMNTFQGVRPPHSWTNRITRETLPKALQAHDPTREYIASSPFIPEGTFNSYSVPEQHNWGPRDYFKGDYYKHSIARFISECGYHGCPSVTSLKKYIPEDKLWPFEHENLYQATHNTEYAIMRRRDCDRNELMSNQVKTLFGSVPDTLEEFALASQISQAEAKKYFIENTRIQKGNRTGILWWNLIDGWPQISDAVVDYYYCKKLAYYYIKRVQQPLCMIMGECNGWQNRVVLCNDTLCDMDVEYKITNGDTGDIISCGREIVKANQNLDLPAVFSIPGEQKLYIMEYSSNGKTYANHYISGYVPMDFEKYKVWLSKIATLGDGIDIDSCYK